MLGQDGSPSNERREYAQVIVRNSTHLLRLVNNLLDEARLATGHVAADPQPASVRQIVRDVVATIDGLPREPGVEVLTQVDPAVPERLLIDELRVRQIVLNLVANAASSPSAATSASTSRGAPASSTSGSRTPGRASSRRPATASSRSSSSAVRRRRGPAAPGSA